MPNDVSRSEVCGFFIPYNVGIDDLHADSIYDEDAVVPGTPLSPDGAALHLEAEGTQESSTYRLTMRRAGDVRPAGAGMTWDKSTDAAGFERGWDPPVAVSHWEALRWGTLDNSTPHARRLPSGEVVAAYSAVVVAPTVHAVYFHRIDHDGSKTTVTIYSGGAPGTALNGSYQPSIAILDDGSILLGHLVPDTIGDEAQWVLYRSVDKGDTWVTVSRFTLDVPINTDTSTTGDGYEIRRARMAASGRHVALLFWAAPFKASLGHRFAYIQYGSTAEALRFERVELASADTGGSPPVATFDPGSFGYPDLISYDGRFLVQYIEAVDQPRQKWLPHATAPLSEQPFTELTNIGGHTLATITGSDFTDGDWALWAEPGGILYAAARDFTASGGALLARVLLLRSADRGRSWTQWGGGRVTDNEKWWSALDREARPKNFCASAGNGRSYVFGNHGVILDDQGDPEDATAATYEESMSVWGLGGSITTCKPAESEFGFDRRRLGWTRLAIPADLPSTSTEWSVVSASGTQTMINGYISTSTSSGSGQLFYNGTVTTTLAQGISILRDVAQIVGGSITSLISGVRIQLRPDTSNNYEIEARFQLSPARVRFWDPVAGAQVGTDVTVDWTTPIRLRMEIRGGRAQAWIGTRDGDSDQDLVEVLDVALALGTGSSGSTIDWGCAIGAGLAETHWWLRAEGYGDQQGQRVLPVVNPDDLWSRDIAGIDGSTFIDGGLHVRGVSGPGRELDTYTIAPESQTPLRNLFWPVSTSPREYWQSADGGGSPPSPELVWDVAASGQDTSQPPMMGWHLAGFRALSEVYVSRYVAGAYTLPVTVPLGYTFNATRVGDVVKPSAGTTGEYFDLDECVGWWLDLGGGVFRQIVANADGVLAGSSGSKAAAFKVAAEAGDPVSITGAILIPPDSTILLNLPNGTTAARWRLGFPGVAAPEDKWRGGCMWLGEFVPMGRRWEWGERSTVSPGAVRQETPDRIGRPRVVAPTRYEWELGWTGILQNKATRGDATAPDYTTLNSSGSAAPASVPTATAETIEGVLRRTNGPERPVVVCTIERVAGSEGIVVLHRRRDAVRGVITGRYTRRRVARYGWRGQSLSFVELI
jgi:hypothetical protein